VVGATFDDDNDEQKRQNWGPAYVFEASTGNFVHELTASDGAGDNRPQCGGSVAVSGRCGAHRDAANCIVISGATCPLMLDSDIVIPVAWLSIPKS